MSQQVVRLRVLYPNFHAAWRGGRVRWVGQLQPSSISQQYLVEIRYSEGGAPGVSVINPTLEPGRDGQPIPHVYRGTRPCLYLPNAQEWTPLKFVADTIIPWTALWLLFYEAWQATGEWLGGGEHPDAKEV